MIRARYIINSSDKYKIVKLLEKLGKACRPYFLYRIRKDKVDISVPKRQFVGELQRRLKHVKGCTFELLEIENTSEDGQNG